jgi:Domain of unknown function (DUF4288)
MTWSKDVSPVGWYVGSYLPRFIELAHEGNDDPERRFLTWENTILVKAEGVVEAYDKIVRFAQMNTDPYKGGAEGVDVQWIFEGVTEVLPVYEEIEDGCEIMWAKYTKKLKNIRNRARARSDFER